MVVFHEFGPKNGKIIVLIPPACAPWNMWHDYIGHWKSRYRVVAVSLEGHNGVKGEHYTTLEDNARQISAYIKRLGGTPFLLLGVSGGASILLKVLALGEVRPAFAVADAPYVFEKKPNLWSARLIGLQVGSFPFWPKKSKGKLLREHVRDYGEVTGRIYYEELLRLSARTMYREFYTYFTFVLPEDTGTVQTKLGLWYGEQEKEKLENAVYLQKRFPAATVKVFPGYNHADYWMKDRAGYLRDLAAFTGDIDIE